MAYDGQNWMNMKESDFAEGKKVTDKMLKTYWNNDEYLKRQTDELWNESMPVTRKKFTPPEMDDKKSYSAMIQDKEIIFDNSSYEARQLDLEDEDDFDFDKSTAEFEDGEIVCTTVAGEKKGDIDTSTRDYGPLVKFQKGHEGEEDYVTGDSFLCNAYWPISYPKNKTYHLTAKQKKDGTLKMPSVCRAQVFKAKTTGYLESLTLRLRGGHKAGYKLVVEIVDTETHKVKGKSIVYPASRGTLKGKTKYKNKKVLAKEKISFKRRMQMPGMFTIKFKKKPKLTAGQYYAFVLRSPGTRFKDAYRIGGWGKDCHPYKHQGIAFMSRDNGYTWIPYGDREKKTGHSQDKIEPLYFAYQCRIREIIPTTNYVKSTLYSKAFMFNRINELGISYSQNVPYGCAINYFVSGDGKNWKEVNENLISFSDTIGRNMVLLKAELTPSNDKKQTPAIQGLSFIAHLSPPTEAVVRTKPYQPRNTGILAAHVFGAINTPYILSNPDHDSVTVDIVKESTSSTIITIFDPTEILDYGDISVVADHYSALEERIEDPEALNNYLNNHDEIVIGLILEHLYMIGHIPANKIFLDDIPAYPILNCYLKTPNSDTVNFAEWIDFTVDYSNNVVSATFRDDSVLDEGALTFIYNPCFIRGLTSKDMPFHMDYQIETFIVTHEMKTRGVSYTLKCAAHNPLKSVEVLYDNVISELEEDKDFTVDYLTKTVTFNTYIPESATVTITYVCDYIDEAISLQYNMKRGDVNDSVKLLGNYIEYKT